MAQNITIKCNDYQNVPHVNLPKTGGGTAKFIDVTDTTATAADVAQGAYFYLASGEKVKGTSTGGMPYTGAYEADALFREQVFPTALKTMRQDFLVHAINYTEAPNDSGITVTIGG